MKIFGLEVPDETNRLTLISYLILKDDRDEVMGFEESDGVSWEEMVDVCDGRPSKLWLFYEVVYSLWSEEDVKRSPWLDDMLGAMLSYRWVVLAGCGSSGKSYAAAVFGLVMFLLSPSDTLILITSTSLEGAKKRVWKGVDELWSKLPIKDEIGSLVDSKCMIRGVCELGKPSSHLGLQIVAAGSGSEKDAYDKLIGMKAKRMYLIADELPQLPRMISDVARGNLATNNEKQPFTMIAMGNPNLMTDAMGILAKPKNGWDSISEADQEWETDRGITKRYDAEQNPNIVDGVDTRKYPWLPTLDVINQAILDLKRNSFMFYRQYKAFWFKEAATDTIYSESDIVMNLGDEAYDEERDGKIKHYTVVAGADPAYTQGGDEFPVVMGKVIENELGESFIEVTGVHKLEDGQQKGEDGVVIPRAYGCVAQLKEMCAKGGCSPENFGYDGTGAGITFADVITSEWSGLPMNIQFGGKASDRPAGVNDTRPSYDVYQNRVSELWVKAKSLFAAKKIRGVPPEIIEQIVKRRWNTKTRSGAGKLMVERKVDYKNREGHSPDICDALFCMIEVVVANGLIPLESSHKVVKRSKPVWDKMMDFHDVQKHSDIELEWE